MTINFFFHRLKDIVSEEQSNITYNMSLSDVGKIAQKTWIRVKEQIEIEKTAGKTDISNNNELVVREEDEVQMTDDDELDEEVIEMDDN